MASTTVGVVKETAPGERRVALVPDLVGRLGTADTSVLIESGAGEPSWFPDDRYADAGATVVTTDELYSRADVLLCLRPPDDTALPRLRAGQVLIGLLAPLLAPEFAARLAQAGVTAISLDTLPRTLSRAQSMDALTSQANVAGYKAAVLAADTFGRYFPLLMTAAGTMPPAKVLVLGAGVAGLQAIGTARRLGALVSAYDVRPQARGDIESLGATFVDLGSAPDGAGEGGYARALSENEQREQQDALAKRIAGHDVVITTAQVPGHKPPVLVSGEAVAAMRPGSVLVDLAASELGGNVEASRPGETVVTDSGVTIVGADNLPSQMPAAASTAYARNVTALLAHLLRDGAVSIDTADDIQAGVVITHDGEIVHPKVAELIAATTQGGADSERRASV